jgi:hypothetical protein
MIRVTCYVRRHRNALGAPVNAVFGNGCPEETQRRQRLQQFTRLAAGLPDYHPFCLNKQIQDERELSSVSTTAAGCLKSTSRNGSGKHRQYMVNSVVHTATPRPAVASEAQVARLFDMYEAGKLGPDLQRMVLDAAQREKM